MLQMASGSTGAMRVSNAKWRVAQLEQRGSTDQELEPSTSDNGTSPYFGRTVAQQFAARFPWLLSLMLLQSVSGWIVEQFEVLIQRHVIIASFMTMLVGGGGNSSGQTVAELVRRLNTGEIQRRHLGRVLLRELAIGALLAVGLGMAAFPRVRLLSAHATDLDALTIAIAYVLIVLMANVIAVFVAMGLSLWGAEAVGAPPLVQVLVDVLGMGLTMLVAQAMLSGAPASGPGGADSSQVGRALGLGPGGADVVQCSCPSAG